jgi:hypothetical protein
LRAKSQKIASFAADRNENPPPFTMPALTMARRHENSPRAALHMKQSFAAGWFNRRGGGKAGTSGHFAGHFANGSFQIGKRYRPDVRRQACI